MQVAITLLMIKLTVSEYSFNKVLTLPLHANNL